MLNDALRYMQVKAKAQAQDLDLINKVTAGFERLNNIVVPRKVYGKFSIIRENNFLNIAGINLSSANLKKLLENSQECCLMAVTLGHEADREILRVQSRSILDGLILDACASVMADVICDELEAEIIANLNNLNLELKSGAACEAENNFKNLEPESNVNLNNLNLNIGDACEIKNNLKLTPRFSPGYGDVSLNVSQDIIDVLNANKYIGLSMTSSGMMSPVKSITAIAGIISAGEIKFNKFNRCGLCNHKQACSYNK